MLEEHAEELGVVERDSKLQIPALVWAFVFGFAAGESRTLAAFRRSYNSTADKTLTAGGFYQRLTPLLAEFLCDLVERRLDEVAVPHTITDEFDRFIRSCVSFYRYLRTEIVPDIWFINRGESALDLLFQRRKIRDETVLEPFVESIPASLHRVELR